MELQFLIFKYYDIYKSNIPNKIFILSWVRQQQILVTLAWEWNHSDGCFLLKYKYVFRLMAKTFLCIMKQVQYIAWRKRCWVPVDHINILAGLYIPIFRWGGGREKSNWGKFELLPSKQGQVKKFHGFLISYG